MAQAASIRSSKSVSRSELVNLFGAGAGLCQEVQSAPTVIPTSIPQGSLPQDQASSSFLRGQGTDDSLVDPPFFTPPHLDSLSEPPLLPSTPQATPSHNINIFYSDVSTWGPQAEDYIFDKGRSAYRADIHLLVEHHARDTNILRSAFSVIKRGVISNPPGPSRKSLHGTHGGELIAYAR